MMPVIPLRAFVANDEIGAVVPVPIRQKRTRAPFRHFSQWNAAIMLWHRGRL